MHGNVSGIDTFVFSLAMQWNGLIRVFFIIIDTLQ